MVDHEPGVPEALPRALRALAERVPPTTMDRVWIFPPLRTGRRETGLVAAGCYTDGPRHLLVTLSYRSEETGRGVTFESSFQEEGEAPPDRLPRIMDGVVRRLEETPGDPRSHEVAGRRERLAEIVAELGGELPEPAPEADTNEAQPDAAEPQPDAARDPRPGAQDHAQNDAHPEP